MQTGAMTLSDRDIERRWQAIRARGPYVLLAVATLLALATAELTPAAGERVTAGALVAAGFGLQLWWGRASRTRTGPSTAPPAVARTRATQRSRAFRMASGSIPRSNR